MDAANYSVFETMRNGQQIEIRALRRDDEAGLLAAVGRVSTQSLYRRFFAVRRNFSEKEIDYFLNVDFSDHVALVAVAKEAGRLTIVGGARYIVGQPGSAEIAFAVLDEYQGWGIGAMLMRHLVVIAREAGLKQFIADVLPENTSMLKIFERSGLKVSTSRDAEAVHAVLQL